MNEPANKNLRIIPDETERVTCEHSGITFKKKIEPEDIAQHVCEHSGAIIPAKNDQCP